MRKSNLAEDAAGMRIDKWLWAARFFKTRSIAKNAIEGGKVHHNGERVKVSREVRAGMELTIQQGIEKKSVLVKALSDVRGPAPVAQLLYEETEVSIARRELLASQRKLHNLARPEHRPSKKDRRDIGKLGGQVFRLERRAIGNGQGGRLFSQQRGDHAARRTTGAKQQDTLASQRATEIAGDVAHQAGTVGIVAHDFGIGEKQGVDRAGPRRPLGQARRQAKCLFLEGHRHIRPPASGSDECGNRLCKAFQRGQAGLIRQVLAGLGGKSSMDGRRLGMGNRIAKNGIQIRHGEGCENIGEGLRQG